MQVVHCYTDDACWDYNLSQPFVVLHRCKTAKRKKKREDDSCQQKSKMHACPLIWVQQKHSIVKQIHSNESNQDCTISLCSTQNLPWIWTGQIRVLTWNRFKEFNVWNVKWLNTVTSQLMLTTSSLSLKNQHLYFEKIIDWVKLASSVTWSHFSIHSGHWMYTYNMKVCTTIGRVRTRTFCLKATHCSSCWYLL